MRPLTVVVKDEAGAVTFAGSLAALLRENRGDWREVMADIRERGVIGGGAAPAFRVEVAR